MTYHNAIKYILSSPQKNGAADSFERVRLICERLGSPERRLKYVRFAGSNGKTVCQTMLESVLHEHGIKVGSLLMPVCAEPRENVRIGRAPISMDDPILVVPAGATLGLSAFFILAVPVAFAVTGLVIWVRRRRR